MNLNGGEWRPLPKYWYCTQCLAQLTGEPEDAESEAIAHRDEARHTVRIRFTRELLLKPKPQAPVLRMVPALVPPPAHEDAACVEKRYADVDLAVLAQSVAWPPGGGR